MNEKEKERNSHIDESRSHENKYLVQKDLKELYQEEFGEALENYNAKQKRSDRKIDDYYKHIQSSKKTSLQQEMIIQVGDLNDFPTRRDYEKANEILLEWFEKFEERNPNLKVYNAVIHNDEASPHMHLNFVPVADGYKRGLEKQVSFDKAIIQQDAELDKIRPFDDWREKEVQLLEKMLLERGIERKLVGTNNYKDVNEYKEKQDLEREIEFLEGKIGEKKNELLALSEKIPTDGDVKIRVKGKEVETEVIQRRIGKSEVIKKETENLIVTPKELKNMQEMMNAAYQVKKDYERLQKTDLVQENKKLREENEELSEAVDRLYDDWREISAENYQLKEKNRALTAVISDLTAEIKLVYKSTKEFVKERTSNAMAFKDAFKSLVSKIKQKAPGGEFEKAHQKDLNKEKNRGME